MAQTQKKISTENPKKILCKADILGGNDITIHEVEIKEWNGTVRLRKMSLLQQIEMSKNLSAADTGGGAEKADAMVEMIIASVVGEDGQQVFSPEDAAALRQKSGGAIYKLFIEIQRINNSGIDVDGARGN